MTTDHQQHDTQTLAAMFACRALQIMGERAGLSPDEILAIVDADPEGATAQYFRDLMQVALETTRTHAMINAPSSAAVQ
jgi:hypothetical protein